MEYVVDVEKEEELVIIREKLKQCISLKEY